MRTSFNIPDDLLTEFDRTWQAEGFDYQHERVIRELHDVQHDFQDVITTTSHTHEGDWCLEVIFCRGQAARVRELVYRLRDFDAVGRVKVLLLRS